MAAVAACSDALTSANDRATGSAACPDGGACSGSKGVDGGEFGGDPNASPAVGQGGPASDGVLIVHAATFPSIRLCFENLPDLVPQPDATVMPEANVVGVEQGSIVRINPIATPPGRVYVIREKDLREKSPPGDPAAMKCGELFPKDAAPVLERGSAFVTAGSLTEPVGVTGAELLAVYGCAIQTTLNNMDDPINGTKADNKRCGAGYEESTGNVAVKTIRLTTSYEVPTKAQIPVQLLNVAPAIEALKGTVTVKFGEQGQPGEPLAIGATFSSGDQLKLDVNQDDLSSYASQGFEVNVKLASETVTATQTLADVQSLSSPSDTPSHYYQAASNYALLLLGDPSHKPTLAGGKANPTYNPRRALHILAVPVLDPSKKADAGADAAADAETP